MNILNANRARPGSVKLFYTGGVANYTVIMDNAYSDFKDIPLKWACEDIDLSEGQGLRLERFSQVLNDKRAIAESVFFARTLHVRKYLGCFAFYGGISVANNFKWRCEGPVENAKLGERLALYAMSYLALDPSAGLAVERDTLLENNNMIFCIADRGHTQTSNQGRSTPQQSVSNSGAGMNGVTVKNFGTKANSDD